MEAPSQDNQDQKQGALGTSKTNPTDSGSAGQSTSGDDLDGADRHADSLSDQPVDGTVVQCASPTVSVSIAFDQTKGDGNGFGCPGHVLTATATGSPAGGTYQWALSGAGLRLGDGVTTAQTLKIIGFSADPNTGQILALNGKVSVAYTASGGSAKADADVAIHGIKFEVTNLDITHGDMTTGLQQLSANAVTVIVQRGASPIMHCSPSVKMDVDGCLRPEFCIPNHVAGDLQTVTQSSHETHWKTSHSVLNWGHPLRDSQRGAPEPFNHAPSPFQFDQNTRANHDTQSVTFEDDPSTKVALWDSKSTACANNNNAHSSRSLLQDFSRSVSLTTWLVVQNLEFRDWLNRQSNSIMGCFAFLGNFDWSFAPRLQLTTPAGNAVPVLLGDSQKPVVPTTFSPGTGGNLPVLVGPNFNDYVADRGNYTYDPDH